MKPIFFSDIDNTLIFSDKSIAFPTEEKVHPLDIHVNGGASYLGDNTLQLLQKLSHEIPFVPTTTRHEQQYTRMHFADVKIEYAIISNGAAILHNGERDQAWADHVRINLLGGVDPLVIVQKQAEEILDRMHIERRGYTVENLFIYFHLLDLTQLTPDAINAFELLADQTGWKLSIQKTKVYFIPTGLTKGAAVQELTKRLGGDTIIAAGDSILDLSMLEVADTAYMIAPGELADTYGALFNQVPGTGFTAASNLIQSVIDSVSEGA